jgi:hypothetical protein
MLLTNNKHECVVEEMIEMKKILFLFAAAVLLASISAYAETAPGATGGNQYSPFDENQKPGQTITDYNKSLIQGFYCGNLQKPALNYLRENEPPSLRSVSILPEKPGPNDSINVSALINNDPGVTLSRTVEAHLYYSTDGKKTWNSIEMAGPGGGGYWQAKIPAVQTKTTLYYFFTASDNEDNYYMEIPKTDVKWGTGNDPEYVDNIVLTSDTINTIPPDLDMLSVSIAYDGDNLYLSEIVKGEISAGIVTPMQLNIYTVGFFPMQLSRAEPTYILLHSQLAQYFDFPVIGLLDSARSLTERTGSEARYYSKANHLSMRVNKDAVLQPGEKGVRMIFGNALGTQCNPVQAESKDTSGFINAVFGERKIEIQ